ncbi:MAG: formylglycine-generating enzyme family protein [Alphaproteobacteria bacterium]|nr:formylglycine-generating enzyme family protein [Alphaproteobacteria bacterium]
MAATACMGAIAQPNPAQIDWVTLDGFEMARTETTIGQFARFVAATGTVTQAERDGGGQVYEAGWVRKAGWTWRTPLGGKDSHDLWPAVHVSYAEAQAFCRWAGGQLPTDSQWVKAAYTEMRSNPPTPFQRGQTYIYPTGSSPQGAQCLNDCGPDRSQAHVATLWRGLGPELAGRTLAGVNGLFDMGANAWEWVDEPVGQSATKRTRGGSWWYGAEPMRADHLAIKEAHFSVVYIGFRCAKTLSSAKSVSAN